ncbi:hypothetical protein BFR96_04995 [Acinetobacter pittii]|nr:hypothetical protein BFR96_04995 [Acinetobacter pittii]
MLLRLDALNKFVLILISKNQINVNLLALLGCDKFSSIFISESLGDLDMEILKFLQSFNTVGTYLTIASTVLVGLIIYFYVINPA